MLILFNRIDRSPPSAGSSFDVSSTKPPTSGAPSINASENSLLSSTTFDSRPAIRDTLPINDYSTFRGHSLLKKTLGLNPRGSTYVGTSSVLDYGFLAHLPFDRRDEAELSSGALLRRVAPDAVFRLDYDRSNVEINKEIMRSVDDIERIVAPHGQALLDLYFRIVHPSFPILHKKVFLEKYSRTHRELSPPLLAAVYCLALNWWSYDPELAQLPKPDADRLAQIAHKTFSDVIMLPKISTVQAGLLLLQRRQDSSSDWPLCSHVVALAEELGLGLECEKWRVPKWERGLRRRLAWAVWLQDKWHALTQSRPSHIDKRNWIVKNVTSDDFPETAADESDQDGSAEVENGRRLFQEMISLSDIVHEVLSTFFTVSSERELHDIEQILEKAKPIQIKLKDWYQSLPDSLRMNSQPKMRKLSSNGSLHVAYFATEITLHRRIIHALTPTTPAEIVAVVRQAARVRLQAAMDFVRNLKPEHIQAFWYASSATNFAIVGTFAALLFATALDSEERNFYKACLDEYRWSLRVSSRGFEQMAVALQKLDLAIGRIPMFEIEKRPSLSSKSESNKHDVPVKHEHEENEEDEDEDEEDEEERNGTREDDRQPAERPAEEDGEGPFEEDELYNLSAIQYWNGVSMFMNQNDGTESATPHNADSAPAISSGDLRALSASGSAHSSPEQHINHFTDQQQQQAAVTQANHEWIYQWSSGAQPHSDQK